MNKPLEDHTVAELLAVFALSGCPGGGGLAVSVDVYAELERRIDSKPTPKPFEDMTTDELWSENSRLYWVIEDAVRLHRTLNYVIKSRCLANEAVRDPK